MFDVPDAPWIRDAENNGVPQLDWCCPVCGEENPEEFYVDGSIVVGCSKCLRRVDAWEWTQDNSEEGV